MDSRAEPRFPADTKVKVTLLQGGPAGVSGQVVNMSGRGLKLFVGRPLPAGAAVKVEANDTLLLGEIVYCRAEAGGFAVGLQLKHALFHLRELARLSAELMGTPEPTEEVGTLRRRIGRPPGSSAG